MSQNLHDQSDENKSINFIETFHKFKKYLYVVGAILLLIPAYFGYKHFVVEPRNEEAMSEMFRAEQYFEQDSFRLALNGDVQTKGFLTIIDEFGGTKSSNLAQFYAGVCLMKLAEYQEAINHFEKFSGDSEFFVARSLSNIGDCYAELNKLPEAATYYTKAAKHNDNDLAADYLMKAGATYGLQNDYQQALVCFEQIKTKYPQTIVGRDIDKYILFAKTKIAK